MELQQWIFPTRFFWENLKLGEGGEEGRDNDIRDHARKVPRQAHHDAVHGLRINTGDHDERRPHVWLS